ncbi:MAG TPA: YkvA family protein [Desulfosporosinus sp.]|nr:YkvA family protein [Desulfosporosinus sp.]
MSDDYQNKFSQAYSEKTFWDKVQKYALSAGIKVIYVVLLLYYALREPKTPSWAKGVILGALGYFISPIDVIPDIVPVAGFTDDLGVLVLELVAVGMFIDNNVKSKAREKVLDWFPNVGEEEFSEIDEKLK